MEKEDILLYSQSFLLDIILRHMKSVHHLMSYFITSTLIVSSYKKP
jgi:hypothetical protein